ncbi:hypothetical protein MUK42_18323, partial [Musa troglodytarum]
FNASSFLANPRLCRSASDPCSSSSKDQHHGVKSQLPGKLKLLFALGLLTCSLVFAITVAIKTQSMMKRNSRSWKLTAFQKLEFTSEDIVECLKENCVIGRGGAGIVYRGTTPNGEQVAVKRLLGLGKGSTHDNGLSAEMASKPLTTEAIALTEKKMDMALDDIIKMSKKNPTKGKRPPRPAIKSQGFQNGNTFQGTTKLQRFIDSRSSIRQGVLTNRRSTFHGYQFPVTTEVANKAAAMPVRNRRVNRNVPRFTATLVQRKGANGSFNAKDKAIAKQKPQTLDALFANMKVQRLRLMTQKVNRENGHQIAQRRNVPWQQPRRGGARLGTHHQFGNFAK